MATTTIGTDYPIGVGPQNILLGDINGDGSLDIITANGSDVSVLLGNGKGSFLAAVNYPKPAGNYSARTLSDINGDGKVDLLLDTAYLPGDGQGGFGLGNPYPDNLNLWTSGDLNNDGNLDLVLDSIRIYLGDGTGNFTPKSASPFGVRFLRYVAPADFNHDGKADLLFVQGRRSFSTFIWLGDGTGNFDFNNPIAVDPGDPSGLQPALDPVGPSILVGDVNHDGNLDVITNNRLGPRSGFYYELAVSLGAGTDPITNQPLFNAPLFFAPGNYRGDLKLTDLNGDENLDIVSTNYELNSTSVLWGYGDGTFSAEMFFATGVSPTALAVGDVDSDGAPNIITVNAPYNNGVGSLPGTVSILEELRPAVEQKFLSPQQLATSSFPDTVNVGDVNGDGRLDLVAIANGDVQSVETFWGDGKGTEV